MKLDLLLHRRQNLDFEVPLVLLDTLKMFTAKGREVYGDNYRVTLSYPHKSRTTGKNSQNTRIAFLCNVIAAENSGIDGMATYQQVKDLAKLRAIKRGYPYRWRVCVLPDGTEIKSIEPWHENELDTVQAGLLIEELEFMAAESGIDVEEIEKYQ